MKNCYVSNLSAGNSLFSEDFAVKKMVKATTKNGKEYLDIELSDNTGSVKGKVWSDNLPNFQGITEGDIISIDATIDRYRDSLQLIITKGEQVTSFNPADFSQSSSYDIEKMWDEICEYREKIKNRHLKKLLDVIFTDEIAAQFKNSAAAFTVHHAYRGGLVEHTLEMLKMTDGVVERYPKINKDILISGIIVHDLGKIFEYETGVVVKLTTEGKLLGHIFMGANLVKMSADKDIPQSLLDEILHIILSHHGQLEFGSPIKPKTAEAIAISALDSTSADLNMSYNSIHQLEKGIEFTAYHRQLGTELYRSPYIDELLNEDIPF